MFQEELELARTRGELTKLLRGNEKLEDDLDAMDKKIGLLVQNRISVQESWKICSVHFPKLGSELKLLSKLLIDNFL